MDFSRSDPYPVRVVPHEDGWLVELYGARYYPPIDKSLAKEDAIKLAREICVCAIAVCDSFGNIRELVAVPD